MNILINTFTNNNIGQRLQNYALQQKLRKYGNVYTLFHRSSDDYVDLQKIKHKMKSFIKACLRPICKRNSHLKNKNFKDFNKNITFEKKLNEKQMRFINKKYDICVVGSDQVVNSSLWDLKRALLPEFKKQKIAYAASVSRDSLTASDAYLFEKHLNFFKAISVSESEAETLLQPFTHNEVQTVLDPPLLLSAEDWQKVERRPKNKYKFLGGNVFQSFNFFHKKKYKEQFLKIREKNSILQSYNTLNQNQNTFIKKVKRKLKRIFKIK